MFIDLFSCVTSGDEGVNKTNIFCDPRQISVYQKKWVSHVMVMFWECVAGELMEQQRVVMSEKEPKEEEPGARRKPGV